MRKTKLLTFILAFSFFFITGTAASVLAMDITLAWDANTEANLAGYKIYYDRDSGHPYSGTGALEGSSPIEVALAEDENPDSQIMQFTIHNLPTGIYYIAVTAFTTEGLESGYSNEVMAGTNPPPATAPVISSLEVEGQTGATLLYTNDPTRQVDIRIVATDDVLVSQYLILDGDSDPTGDLFFAVPGGARQNPIFTVGDFYLNNTDGNHTLYAWVKDDQGLVSAAATKTNVILDRVAPTVAVSYSNTSYYKAGDSITITANFTDSNPISGIPAISINYAGTGSDISGAAMTQVTNKQWRYVTTAPSGNEGTATVAIAASDAAGNALGSHSGNTFSVDSSSPAIVGYPSINHTDGSITVTYSEGGMVNAAVASNYSFNNGLLLSGNGTDTSGINKVFRFPVNAGTLQRNVIYTMQVGSAVTDSVGRAVAPNTARINDNDNDGMADDWEIQWFGSITAKNGSVDTDGDQLSDGSEYSYARNNPSWGTNRWNLSPLAQDSDADGIHDNYEVLSGLNPVSALDKDLDLDGDGWSNYEEFLQGTAANDANSHPVAYIHIMETLPVHNAGISPSEERIPNNTAFAVRLESDYGLDMTDPNAVVFSIQDGSRTYTRSLSSLNNAGSKLLRAVPLDAEGNIAYSLWVVYYRSLETAVPGSYAYGETVEVTVSVRDMEANALDPAAYRFRIQAQNTSEPKTPILSVVTTSDTQKTVSVYTGTLKGASITFDSDLLQQIGLEPYFGPVEDIPPLNAAQAVGSPLNLLPPAIFPNGVTLTIPCPGYKDVSGLSLYYYDGEKWVMACDGAGDVTECGQGWMVPGSRMNYGEKNGYPAYIEIQVYHFSAAVAAETPTVSSSIESGGSSCFISSLGGK